MNDTALKIVLLFIPNSIFTINYSVSGIEQIEYDTDRELQIYNLYINLSASHRFYYFFLLLTSFACLVSKTEKSLLELFIWLCVFYIILFYLPYFTKDRFRYPIETIMPIFSAYYLWTLKSFKIQKSDID